VNLLVKPAKDKLLYAVIVKKGFIYQGLNVFHVIQIAKLAHKVHLVALRAMREALLINKLVVHVVPHVKAAKPMLITAFLVAQGCFYKVIPVLLVTLNVKVALGNQIAVLGAL